MWAINDKNILSSRCVGVILIESSDFAFSLLSSSADYSIRLSKVVYSVFMYEFRIEKFLTIYIAVCYVFIADDIHNGYCLADVIFVDWT